MISSQILDKIVIATWTISSQVFTLRIPSSILAADLSLQSSAKLCFF